jgi:hypothetical protein
MFTRLLFVSTITGALALVGILSLPSFGISAEVPGVGGDDIFGFTSPTEIGNPGDNSFVNENDGRFGKRDGVYRALNTKYEFSKTLSDSWWLAGSFFGAFYHVRDVPGFDDVSQSAFDGLSFEAEYRLLKRSTGNPLAVSLSVEPRWGRIDGEAGEVSNSLGAAFKLFADAVIVPDRLFWAANLQFVPQSAEDPMDRSHWINSSSTLASTAVSYQFPNKILVVGVEARLLSDFNGAWLNHNVGNAFYIGPTFLWRITNKIAFNATYQPQIAGHAGGMPGRLDLDNFERAQFRAKIAVAY